LIILSLDILPVGYFNLGYFSTGYFFLGYFVLDSAPTYENRGYERNVFVVPI